MRCLILSDIHANWVALEAVLADAPSFDEVWCLGDLVGYGPNPNECIERIQEFECLCLAGNHDWATLGRLDLETFNTDARNANNWTQTQLTSTTREYLAELPTHEQRNGVYLAHASPREPVWEYILDANLAYVNFTYFDAPVCLVGHTHIPAIFVLDEKVHGCKSLVPPEASIRLGNQRMIINPGSVGQPRDGDPRAAYAVLDVDKMVLEFRRVPYAIEITQERMRARGLPRRLVDRLVVGR